NFARTEANCYDNIDNDGDGKTDCADSDCAGQYCHFASTSCVCGAGVKTESSCNDANDNDGDGKTDCADLDCCGDTACVAIVYDAGVCEKSCANALDDNGNGKTDCADPNCDGRDCGNDCVCSGLLKVETNCRDNQDDDGDGKIDCADTDCNAKSCGNYGKFCAGLTCACSGNGGWPSATEKVCHDNADNDCDSKTDCMDSDCTAIIPAVCETNCTNGTDEDGDALTDCADADCLHRTCGGTATSICCGIGTNALVCKDIASDATNCGICGAVCGAGKTCSSITIGSVVAGRCSCTVDTDCP